MAKEDQKNTPAKRQLKAFKQGLFMVGQQGLEPGTP